MVIVNVNNIDESFSFEFIMYDLDTQKSAITRLAAELNTIPKYLYFPEGIPSLDRLNEQDPITVEDLLVPIISAGKYLDFVDLANKLKGKLDQRGLDLRDDILLPFIAHDSSYTLDGVNPIDILHNLIKQIESENLFEDNSNISLRDLRDFWEKDRLETIRQISKEVNIVLKESNEQKKIFRDFEGIKSKIIATPFEQESVKFEFSLDLTNITVMEIFNHMSLNAEVPFATINNFFKIFKDFNPPKNWEISVDTGIIFKVLQKKSVYGVKDEDYAEGVLTVDGEPGNENISVEMSLFTSENFLQRDEIIDRFLETITGLGVVTIKNVIEKRIKGPFYFPKHTLDKYIFADLVMNNPLFSSMMSIDESEKATNKKESIYIHVHNSKIGELTANLTEKIALRNDSDLRGKDTNETFKFGTTYIRVKIVIAKNIESVNEFKKLLSKLLGVYDQKYQEILDFYRFYIPDFQIDKDKSLLDKTKVKGTKPLTNKDIAPEVFVVGYPLRCANAPTIIDDDDEKAFKEAEDKGLQIMRYPKDNSAFPSRNYVCNKNREARFPGLQKNKFEKNNELVPYLPCCFKKDNNKVGSQSIYRQYFHGEKPKEKAVSTQQDLITTKKFVPPDKYGTLPDNLTKMFEIFDYDEDYVYVRKGVYEANSSFLECVMEGMYRQTGILDVEDRKVYIESERVKLATAANAAACRQEMYDYSIKQIMDIIRDSSLYMEPSLFTSFLEQHFNCNIFVFSRAENNAKLNIPRHIQSYYKNKREANCIFIYEHGGSVADKEKGKRCELIVKWMKSDKHDVYYYYPHVSKVSRGVREVYNKMKQAYALDNQIEDSSILLPIEKAELYEQGFDSYGKCRMLRFKFKGDTVTILTDPLQPFIVKEARNWIATKTLKDTAIKFAKAIKIQLTSQCVRDGYLKELYGIFGGVKVTIPVNDSIPEAGLQEENDRIINITNRSSVMTNYNEYKKLARYITEYMLWLFSKYIHEDDVKTPNVETINNFIEDKIKIDKDFDYGKVSEIFSEDSGVMDDGKLVIKSEETLKRLVYTLRLSLRRFKEKIDKYYKHTIIDKFYVDVTDFDQYPQQVLLHGEDSIDKWNKEKNRENEVHNSVQINLDTPYFFKNEHINKGVIYLVQNTPSLQKAKEIGMEWVKSGFNVDGEATGIDIPSFEFELYRYINSKDIVLYKVEGEPNRFKIRIMGWKLNGVSSFAVLLQL
uniref:Uncharacterized protein n=1 Tax=viral metagenome TaxID=1070528 RepID=A0A6C0H4D6_9ZZZZ